ncbi:MAG: sensor histidine kinase [Acidobacteriota bacterium]
MKTREDLTLAGLVHDLNNVFQTLVSVAAQLEEVPGTQQLAAAVLRSVEQGLHIVTSLQNGNSPATPLEHILYNAQAFVEDFQSAAGHRAARFESDIEAGVELAGQWAWERVFINLFLNSLYAMPDGGTIRITARRTAVEIEITVTDEGAGIPPEVQQRLFEAHVSSHGSSGLGLHIVQSVVNAHGGSVRAENRRGAPGARFAITLPAKLTHVKRAHA